MALADLSDWMDEFTGPDFIWYVKRLSGNDTLANGSHQAGPYIPREFLFEVLPQLDRPEASNPEVWFELTIDSHPDRRDIRAVWYNNKLRDGTRNETRLTNFGGRNSALLDPDSTGSLAVFVFRSNLKPGEQQVAHVWVCDHATEEDLIEDRIGRVDPGKWAIWSPSHYSRNEELFAPSKPRASCWLEPAELPPDWFNKFPTGKQIIEKTIELRSAHGIAPDARLILRRNCEFELFRSLEEAIELPCIENGFATIDEFVTRAQTILQRRKSRSGRSLELHAFHIFVEEGLRENENFSHQPESEPGKRPDFLFPSERLYKSKAFPDNRLRMLAVKTTCKDRWRQVINEADRIQSKHLLTLQEGVSEAQFKEMTDAGVCLVVPKSLVSAFPLAVRPHLQSLESFIGDIRRLV